MLLNEWILGWSVLLLLSERRNTKALGMMEQHID